MTPITGSCHCGQIHWQFTLPVKTVVKCHCNNCRKLQGGDYSSWIVVPASQFKFISGEGDISRYRFTQVSEKHFCPKCGTTVYGINGKHFPENVMVPLGEVNNYTEELAPQIQVYTNDKAQWVKLHDDEPIFS